MIWIRTFSVILQKVVFRRRKKDAIPTSQSRSAKALFASSPKRGADGMYDF